MGFYSRTISITHDKNDIELLLAYKKDSHNTEIRLLINNELTDKYVTGPEDGIMGCELELNGSLSNGDALKATLKTHFFMRPLYKIYVNDNEIFTMKGTWGGA